MIKQLWLLGIVITGIASPAVAADRPNVIVIYTDDQGFGDASCLNPDAKFKTPNLDRLAAEGMTFTDGHCSDSVCTPSRYGLLTGRYSWRTTLKSGVFHAEAPCLIADGRMTLATLLRDAGYRTAMVGKWHLGMDFPGEEGARDWTQPVRDMPLDKGFDYFYGIPASMNYGVLAWFEGRHAAVPPTSWTKKKPNDIAIDDYRIMPPYEADQARGLMEIAPDFVDSECLTRFTDKSIEWMTSVAADARAGKPFFLYLPYTAPHKPVIPTDQFLGKSQAGAYGDFVIETDYRVGQILDFLDQQQLADNTLVYYSSDNGPETTWKKRIEKYQHSSAGIYRDGKRSMYEGGHRVPMFVRWPAKVAGGVRWDEPVCQTDLLATLAEMLQVDMPASAGEDSVSFYHVLSGESAGHAARAPLISHSGSGRFAVRDGRWKLIMETAKKNERRELYDLATDPSETTDVIAAHPDIADALAAKITAIIANGRTTPGAHQPNDTPLWDDLVWMKEQGRGRDDK